MNRGKSEENTRALGFEKKLPMPENQAKSQNLLQDSCMQLSRLMREVTKDEVNPKTVDAACKCADGIHKLLRLNYDLMRKL